MAYSYQLSKITFKWDGVLHKTAFKNSHKILSNPQISDYYLRSPPKSDAHRIMVLQKKMHGIYGWVGSLDVTKIHWAACPSVWKDQFKGKKGYPTMGVDAVVDYNLWILHSAFGFVGSLNGINFCDQSLLFDSMSDETPNKINISFVMNGE